MDKILDSIEFGLEVILKIIISLGFLLITMFIILWLCADFFFTDFADAIAEEYDKFIKSFKEQ